MEVQPIRKGRALEGKVFSKVGLGKGREYIYNELNCFGGKRGVVGRILCLCK